LAGEAQKSRSCVIANFSRDWLRKMLVLYRTSPDGVEILRVIHGSRNILALLRREGVE
jgi:plasmid stabilization system protein ParE